MTRFRTSNQTKQRQRRMGVAIVAATIAAVSGGCKTDYGWQTVDLDTPWIAPGVQATQREHSYEYYMAAGRSTETYWGTGERRGLRRSHVRKAFESFIKTSGWIDEWPVTGSSINDIDQRLAPFRFTVVAIKPTVIVATPLATPSLDRHWEASALFDRPAQNHIHSDYLITSLEFGTTVPDSDRLTIVDLRKATKKDLKLAPGTLSTDYATKGCLLVFDRTNGVWNVTRHAVD